MTNERNFKVQTFPGGEPRFVTMEKDDATVKEIVEKSGLNPESYTKSVSGAMLDDSETVPVGSTIILTKNVKGGIR